MLILVCHCMLLTTPEMVLFMMIVYVYVLHVYYMCMQIINEYNFMYLVKYGIFISLPPPSHNIKTI